MKVATRISDEQISLITEALQAAQEHCPNLVMDIVDKGREIRFFMESSGWRRCPRLLTSFIHSPSALAWLQAFVMAAKLGYDKGVRDTTPNHRLTVVCTGTWYFLWEQTGYGPCKIEHPQNPAPSFGAAAALAAQLFPNGFEINLERQAVVPAS